MSYDKDAGELAAFCAQLDTEHAEQRQSIRGLAFRFFRLLRPDHVPTPDEVRELSAIIKDITRL